MNKGNDRWKPRQQISDLLKSPDDNQTLAAQLETAILETLLEKQAHKVQQIVARGSGMQRMLQRRSMAMLSAVHSLQHGLCTLCGTCSHM